MKPTKNIKKPFVKNENESLQSFIKKVILFTPPRKNNKKNKKK